jgi:Ulp1 family protease
VRTRNRSPFLTFVYSLSLKVPSQDDAHDCGVFVLLYIRHLLQGGIDNTQLSPVYNLKVTKFMDGQRLAFLEQILRMHDVWKEVGR